MFKCDNGHLSKPYEKMTRVVVETRPKVYRSHTVITPDGPVTHNEGTGYETIREVTLCPECADAHATERTREVELALAPELP